MGLSDSPAVWQNFIQRVLNEIPDHRKHYLAIMDDCEIGIYGSYIINRKWNP